MSRLQNELRRVQHFSNAGAINSANSAISANLNSTVMQLHKPHLSTKGQHEHQQQHDQQQAYDFEGGSQLVKVSKIIHPVDAKSSSNNE